MLAGCNLPASRAHAVALRAGSGTARHSRGIANRIRMVSVRICTYFACLRLKKLTVSSDGLSKPLTRGRSCSARRPARKARTPLNSLHLSRTFLRSELRCFLLLFCCFFFRNNRHARECCVTIAAQQSSRSIPMAHKVCHNM